MEIEYLSEFVVIAKLGSFSRAAEELCISQSSLSKHILTLERELGTALLLRNSRNVTLSPTGAQILSLAAQISELKNQIFTITQKQEQKAKSTVSIAALPVMAQYNITELLADFQQEFPSAVLDVNECERQQLLELLEGDKCELAFTRWGLEPTEELEQLELCRDHLVAVLARQHPLAQKSQLTLSELNGVPLLFLDQQTGFQHLYSSLCRNAGFVPTIAYTGHRPENIIALAGRNMGVALLMRRHVDFAKNPDVVTIPLVPAVESAICLVRRKDRKLTPMGQEFWNFVADRVEMGIDSPEE